MKSLLKDIIIWGAIILVVILSLAIVQAALADDPGTETFPGVYGVDWGWQDVPAGMDLPDGCVGGYYWVQGDAPATTTTTDRAPSETNLAHEGEYSDPYVYEEPEPVLCGTYRLPDDTLMVWTGAEWVGVVVPDAWW
jgi:hypothetical protein